MSTPRRTGASTSWAGTTASRESSRSRTRSSPTSVYKELFSGEKWDFLVSKGATAQRPLWASTSTKNPDYRDVMYVEELIGPMTVNTMPEETIQAFQDHGKAALTLEQGIEEAEKVLADLAEAGIDYDDVTETLEREGVEKFADSFAELLEGIRAKSGELVPA